MLTIYLILQQKNSLKYLEIFLKLFHCFFEDIFPVLTTTKYFKNVISYISPHLHTEMKHASLAHNKNVRKCINQLILKTHSYI